MGLACWRGSGRGTGAAPTTAGRDGIICIRCFWRGWWVFGAAGPADCLLPARLPAYRSSGGDGDDDHCHQIRQPFFTVAICHSHTCINDSTHNHSLSFTQKAPARSLRGNPFGPGEQCWAGFPPLPLPSLMIYTRPILRRPHCQSNRSIWFQGDPARVSLYISHPSIQLPYKHPCPPSHPPRPAVAGGREAVGVRAQPRRAPAGVRPVQRAADDGGERVFGLKGGEAEEERGRVCGCVGNVWGVFGGMRVGRAAECSCPCTYVNTAPNKHRAFPPWRSMTRWWRRPTRRSPSW